MAVKKAKEKSFLTKSNRQLLGFVLLLFVFALLLYTTFVLFNEGNIFKSNSESNATATSKQDSGMTSVSIIYKQNSTNISR